MKLGYTLNNKIMAATQNEKALKVIAKQIKAIDENALLFEEVKIRFHTNKVRLELWDIITRAGYSLESRTYKLIKDK